MNRLIILIGCATAAGFVAGITVGRNLLLPAAPSKPHPHSTNAASITAQSSPRSKTTSVGDFDIATGDSSSEEDIIIAIRTVLSHPADRRTYRRIHDLVRGLGPSKVHSVLKAVQQLPNHREKNILISTLISQWADAEPEAALAYAREHGTKGETNWLISDVVTS